MTSKEALENVKKAPSFMGGNPRYWTDLNSSIPFLEDINIIKQDLERLEVLISVLQKFIDEEEYITLDTRIETCLTLGIDGGIYLTQQQCDVLRSVLKFKE